jgi:hypothetical protein
MNTSSLNRSIYMQKSMKNPAATDYIFKVIASSLSIPSKVNGFVLGSNGVTVQRVSRGFVFSFPGGIGNCMYMDVATPIVCTKTFWVQLRGGVHNNTFSTTNNPIWFDGTTFLRTSVNFNTGGKDAVSTISQVNNSWFFYAITMNATTTSLYVNGVLNSTISVNWAGDPSRIYFGAYTNQSNLVGYMDDIRLYSRNLTPLEIEELYRY